MRTCVIGIGNELRRDDALGLEVVRQLQGICPELSGFCFLYDSPEDLSKIISDYDMVFIIDALPPDHQPGRIVDCLYTQRKEQTRSYYSLHDLDLFWNLQYAFSKGFSGKVVLIGIEVSDISLEIGFSPIIKEQLCSIVDKVHLLIAHYLQESSVGNL